MYIIGISAYYHDSAVCLLKDGKIISAIQEERLTRIKHDLSFPHQSLKYCITKEKVTLDQVKHIIFYEKPFLKFERLLETYFSFAPRGYKSFRKSLPLWIKEKLFQKKLILDELEKIFGNKKILKEKLLFSEHHLSHAASAFFPSPFEEAAILTLDGVGEWASSSISIGYKNKIEMQKEIYFPHSLGLLYSSFTYYLGFKVNSGEYKVMGLAPYGSPKYSSLIKNHLIEIKDDGSFFLNMEYFDYCTDLKMTNEKFDNLFGGKPRSPETYLSQKHMDIAASIQNVTEEVVLNICKNIFQNTNQKNLCIAGGVALNCVSNGKIIQNNLFENIWIQPAAGDAGGAIGAAYVAYYMSENNIRHLSKDKDEMKGAYIGPKYQDEEIKNCLDECKAKYEKLTENELIEVVAKLIAEGKAIGWMQGQMEFGPRALGNRSILADPRSPQMQKQLNFKIKFRESFRPFAPSILEEELTNWFEIRNESPYMLLVANVKEDKLIKENIKKENYYGIEKLKTIRSKIPAVTHVDNSARIQTVSKKTNRLFHKLITEFFRITGIPMLINTSFNVRGEPIVCSTKDAFNCFMGTDLDILVVGNYLLRKDIQNRNLRVDYKNKYKLD